MKFSVLLPTRNRLEYLRYAVETVRRQDYDNWEIIVSDNDSAEDIRGFVDALADDRIVYLRTGSFVPVTENWNNALSRSTGDYVVMLGDDDGLLPGYFSSMLQLFKEFAQPDFVYVSALFYAYPGVMPDEPQGFLRRDRNRIFHEQTPFWLDAQRARGIARGYLDFKMPVASNMQFSLISRRKLEEFSQGGAFFQSPYPDFYATPALFLKSSKILVCPKPMVVIGITPKSYGYFHFNNRATEGVDFLKNSQQLSGPSPVESLRLPGTSYYDSWLMAMEALRMNHSGAYDMLPNYGRYRFLQIVHSFKRCYYDETLPSAQLAPLLSRMTLLEKLTYGIGIPIGFRLMRAVPNGLRAALISRLRRLIGQHAIANESATERHFTNLVQVFDAIDRAPGVASGH